MNSTPSTREQVERFVVLLRRALVFWKRGVAVFILGALVSAGFAFTRPRFYKSETIILYQETIHSSDLLGGEGSSDGAHRVGGRLRELLFSRASLEPIIKSLDLYSGRIVRGEYIEAVEEMRKNIVFRAQQEGDTYAISYTGASPLEAQEVTRRLGECIIQEAATRRQEKAKALEEFLTVQSRRNEVELKQKESDLARFIVLHPEFESHLKDRGADQPKTLPAVRAGGDGIADPLLSSLETRAAQIRRQLDATPRPSTPNPKPGATFQPPPDGPDLVTARRDLAQKLSVDSDKHPDVIAARHRLASAEAAQAELNEAAATLWRAQHAEDPGPPATPADEATLRNELANLQGQISTRRLAQSRAPAVSADDGGGATGTIPSGSVESELEFRRLQQDVGETRNRQEKLESQLFRASITASSVMDDRNIQVSVLDPAYLPIRPTSKPRSTVLEMALAVSIVVAIAATFVSAFFDDRIYDRDDLGRLDILPVVAVIPKPPARRIKQLPSRPA